jgi:hypothetical protein
MPPKAASFRFVLPPMAHVAQAHSHPPGAPMRIALAAFALLTIGNLATTQADSPYANAPTESPYADAAAESPYAGSTPEADAARLKQIELQAKQAEIARRAAEAQRKAEERAEEARAQAEAEANRAARNSDPLATMSTLDAVKEGLRRGGFAVPGQDAASGTVTGPYGTYDWQTSVDPNAPACQMVKVAAPEEQARCQAGIMGSCYRAAAAACQAAINAGGCGTPIGELQDCVRENLASSEALKSNAPYFDPNGTSSSQQPNYTPPLPSQGSGSDSGPACGYESLEAANRAGAAC